MKRILATVAFLALSGCITPAKGMRGATHLVSVHHSDFLFIDDGRDSGVYECRTAGPYAKDLDGQASAAGAKPVCVKAVIVTK
jgi:hypothetical protein